MGLSSGRVPRPTLLLAVPIHAMSEVQIVTSVLHGTGPQPPVKRRRTCVMGLEFSRSRDRRYS
jgi:hypothetical protein